MQSQKNGVRSTAFLQTNFTTSHHGNRLAEWISQSTDVFVAVAFLKQKGLVELLASLQSLLGRGDKLTVVVGTDFFLTEPAALKDLFKMAGRHPLFDLRVFTQSPASVFHPKYYRCIGKDWVKAIVGSANLAGGGLLQNIEVSAAIGDSLISDLAKDLAGFEASLISDPRCARPTEQDLRVYEAQYDAARRVMKKAEKQVNEAISEIVSIEPGKLQEFLMFYRGDTKEQRDLVARTTNYHDARKLITRTFLKEDALTEAEFRAAYGKLVGARGHGKLWHSGGIHRSINKIAPQHDVVQSMVRDIAAHLERSASEMFALGRNWMKKIKGLGPNVFTEFCNTFRPEKYAVLNLNPLTSLRKLGQGAFPAQDAFRATDYQDYCQQLDELRRTCGFNDLGETDHFLNYVYQRTRPPVGTRIQ